MKNVKFRGIPRQKTNSAVKFPWLNSAAKTQIPRLGTKFRGPRKTVGPSDLPVGCLFSRCTDDGGRLGQVGECHCSVPKKASPPCHRMSVSPSGRFPSVLDIPWGSLMLGTPASVRLRLMISFKYMWLAYLPGPRPQDKPCEPSAMTNPPQGRIWGSQVLAPSVGMRRFLSSRHQASKHRPSVAAQVTNRLHEQQTPL